MNNTPHTHYADAAPLTGAVAAVNRISWAAVLAGMIVAMTLFFMLSLLGLGIGIGTVDPLEEQNPLAGLGIGAAIWWGLSLLLALFAGGWVAGRLAGMPRAFDSMLHGIITFCLFTILLFWLLTTSLSRLIGGVSRVVGNTVSMASSGIAAVAPEAGQAIKGQLEQSTGIDLDNLRVEANELLQQTGKPALQPQALKNQVKQAGAAAQQAAGTAASNPQAADESGTSLINRLFGRADGVLNAADKEAAVNVIVARTGKSRQEAEQTVANWTRTYEQAKVQFEKTKAEATLKAKQAADATAAATSKAAIYTFLGLLLGAVAAAFGGKTGEPRDLVLNTPAVR